MMIYPSTLNDPLLDSTERLAALRAWQKDLPESSGEINNHIHTIYSFSPYTPVMAALRARESGLAAAGSVDHDSIAAAREMLEAAAILGIGGCAGFELRVSFKTGPFAGRKINNPDSEGIVYMTVQGIPNLELSAAAEFLKPVREQRLLRTKAMTTAANALLHEAKIPEIEFEQDIYNQSKYADGGEITERHLLAAIAQKFILKFGKGRELIDALKTGIGIAVPPHLGALLGDSGNPHYLYDLLGVLKSELLPGIFIQPDALECIPAERVTAFAEAVGAISAYNYLGDIAVSPTGDKKAEKFEDDFIEELFTELSHLGYKAVTYMPPRNSAEQLRKVQRLCAQWGFMEISGVDINSSRQSFNCPEVLQKEFLHLIDTTWALIAHERLASIDKRFSLFSAENPLSAESLSQRITIYAGLGKRLDLFNPEESAVALANEIVKG